MKDPHDTVTIEIERMMPTKEKMLKAMAEAVDDTDSLHKMLSELPNSTQAEWNEYLKKIDL